MTKLITNRVSGKTTDYSKFAFPKGNRVIHQQNVLKIINSMKLHGNKSAISCREIACGNETILEIVDGQHRFEACKELKLPVHYDVWDDLNDDVMIALNENQRNWSLEDYLNCGVYKNIPDYLILQEYTKKTDFGVAALLYIFGNQGKSILAERNNHGKQDVFKSLTWRIFDREKGEKLISALQDFYKKFYILFYCQKKFVGSFGIVFNSGNYDHNRMMRKLALNPKLLQRQPTIVEYITNLEQIYNLQLESNERSVIFPKGRTDEE